MNDEITKRQDGINANANLGEVKVGLNRLLVTRLGGERSYCGQFPVGRYQDFVALIDMQRAIFGAVTPMEVIHQVLLENKGVVYVGIDGTGKKIGYTVVKTGKLDENRIQAELRETDSLICAGVDLWNLKYFHDHYDYDVPQDTVVLHELGIIPSEQRKKYAKELLRQVRGQFEAQHGPKFWMAFVRINNIGSITSLTRALGMSMIEMQGPPDEKEVKRIMEQVGPLSFHGSLETNFRGDNIVPALDVLPDNSKTGKVWLINDPYPKENFFLPMVQGEQSDLRYYTEVVAMLKMKMAYGRIPVEGEDFVMRKVCTSGELEKLGIKNIKSGVPYLFFTKEWEYGT